MYYFLFFLLLLLAWNLQKEPFTVHIEGDMGIFNNVHHSFSSMKEGVHHRILKPVYHSILDAIPFKPHYRRFRREMFK